MSEHNIKIWPEYFQAVLDGTKTFEVRKDDRGYQVGDTLVLQEWWPPEEVDGQWTIGFGTGRECRRTVTYILHGPAFGIEDGYVVMGIREDDVK